MSHFALMFHFDFPEPVMLGSKSPLSKKKHPAEKKNGKIVRRQGAYPGHLQTSKINYCCKLLHLSFLQWL